MESIRERMRHISIRQRLIGYFLLAILVPSLLIAAFQYWRSTRSIQIELNQFAQQNLVNAETAITQKLNLVNDLVTLTNINVSLQNIFMREEPVTLEASIQEIAEIENILSGYFISSNYLSVGAGIFPRLYMENRESYNQVRYDAQFATVYNTSQIKEEAWYQNLTNHFTILGLDMNSQRTKKPVLTAARKLFNTKKSMDTAPTVAVLVIEMDISSFETLLTPFRYSQDSDVYVTDAAGRILMCTDSSQIGEQLPFSLEASDGQGLRLIDGKKEQYMINQHAISQLGWYISSRVPIGELNAKQRALDTVYIIMISACMAFAFMTACMLSRHISRPIRQLVDSMEHVYSKEGFVIHIDYAQQDEFGYLIKKYREMIKQIQELIDKLYISDLNKKDAQIKAKEAELAVLQAKINPHFLYNVLDSIHMYALKFKVPQISTMLLALADFYRYSLSKGRDIITIEDELTIIDSYLILQKMRYGELISYTVDVPMEVRRCLIVKFSLQPLVENAIEHGGYYQQKITGTITISGKKQEDRVILTISDNGEGADIEKIQDILASEDLGQPSFGIRNVDQRIRNFFGNEYGLNYRKNEDQGVTVSLTLPVFQTMEGYYAKNGRRR